MGQKQFSKTEKRKNHIDKRICNKWCKMELLTIHWWVPSQSLNSGKHFPNQLPSVLLRSMTSYGMGYSFVHFRSSVLVLFPSRLCKPTASLLTAQCEKLVSPWFCLRTAHYSLNISVLSKLCSFSLQNMTPYWLFGRKLTLCQPKPEQYFSSEILVMDLVRGIFRFTSEDIYIENEILVDWYLFLPCLLFYVHG